MITVNKYITTLRVRGNELDSFGHVNNAVYMNYYEQARWEVMEAIGMLDYFNESGMILAVAEAWIRYSRELKLLQQIIIETTYRKEGPYLVFTQRILNDQQEICSRAVFKTVLLDQQRIPHDIPVMFFKNQKDGAK